MLHFKTKLPLLASTEMGNVKAEPIVLSENIEAAPIDMIRVAKEFGFEGIVAKRKDSVYQLGKRRNA